MKYETRQSKLCIFVYNGEKSSVKSYSVLRILKKKASVEEIA